MARYIRVSPDLAADGEFDYRVPEELEGLPEVGSQVRVPFGRTHRRAFVTAFPDEPACPPEKLRDIEAVLPAPPLFDEGILALARWMARYYLCSLPAAFRAVLPAAVRREGADFLRRLRVRATEKALALPEAELAALAKRSPRQAEALVFLRAAGPEGGELADLCRRARVDRPVWDALEKKGLAEKAMGVSRRAPAAPADGVVATAPPRLTGEQEAALGTIRGEMASANPRVVLLHGVTGSGKTEVYLQAIATALTKGQGAIALVPEISLTPQTQERFLSRFGGQVAVLHSRLGDGERYDEWQRIARGEARVVVGARSALFAPVRPLGLILVDEEHESAYKQEEAPRYNARDVAVYRASLCGAAVVLGSATPSLESYANALRGRYRLVEMPHRVRERAMPEVHLVDMRHERSGEGAMRLFSTPLVDAVRARLAAGEQTILFLNRRGYATALTCEACGEILSCPDCSVRFTYHRARGRLVCHTCGMERAVPENCPHCGAPYRKTGTGTERIEETAQKLFPRANIARMDSDTTARKGSHDRILGAFRRGEIDILIGTQMIAKGLDFPRVTLVGVMNADAGLQMPDFRSGERTFQLLTQVAGRAGRGEVPGEVFFQTFQPDNPTLKAAAKEDYRAFWESESAMRQVFKYPPYSRMARLVFSGPVEDAVQAAAKTAGSRLKDIAPAGTKVLGPAAAPLAKAKGAWRFQLLVRTESAEGKTSLPSLLRAFLRSCPPPSGIAVTPTIDPISFL
jgi:primosomal protein N' (replication factor Y)